jgi:hypothetical protein
MNLLIVRNLDLDESVEIASNKFTSLLEDYPSWKHTHNIVVKIGELKFKCDSEAKLELLSSIEDPNDLKKCTCKVVTHYGYVIAFSSKDGVYDLESADPWLDQLAHCDNCHNVWDGNAQCNCYGLSYEL